MPPPYSYQSSIKSDVSDELVNVYLQRPIASLITRAVFSTPITPNQLTLIGIFFGIAGGALLALPDAKLSLAAFCFYSKDIFDSADGQLARAKQQFSRKGRFLDSIGDFLVNVFLFGGVFFFLLKNGMRLELSLLISIVGFLGVNLRVSYHVFYQTSFLHSEKQYQTNRLSEDLQLEDYQQDRTTIRLQKIFIFLYRWQDRMMKRIDAWCLSREVQTKAAMPMEWYQNAVALRLSGVLGIGTEYVALTLCLLARHIDWYLFTTLIFFNAVWAATILYRKTYLAEVVSMKKNE